MKRSKQKPVDGFIVELSAGYYLGEDGSYTINKTRAKKFKTEQEAEAARSRFMTHGS